MRKYFALLAGILTIGIISELGVDDHHHDLSAEAVALPIVNEL